jgi:hypothetical protein
VLHAACELGIGGDAICHFFLNKVNFYDGALFILAIFFVENTTTVLSLSPPV